MQPRLLLLEDDPERRKWFTFAFTGWHIDWATTVEEAIEFAQKNIYDLIHLDHDLGDFSTVPKTPGYLEKHTVERTGYDFAKWLARSESPQQRVPVVIHSMNPGGAQRMYDVLWAERDTAIVPFTMLITLTKP